MPATLYVVPASHPCAAVERALQLKGVDFRRVDFVPVLHKAFQKARFREGATVPGIVFEDGRKVLGSQAIMRALEAMRPEPALLPAEPAARARVEEAETWAVDVLQPIGRRIIWTALWRRPSAQLSYSEGAKLFPPVPTPVARMSGKALGWAAKRMNSAAEDAVRADLLALPSHLDRIEAWLGDGTLGGEPPNVADLQVAAVLRLLGTLEDLAPLLDRPAGQYARRVLERYPGHCPAGVLPAAWLPARAAAHA